MVAGRPPPPFCFGRREGEVHARDRASLPEQRSDGASAENKTNWPRPEYFPANIKTRRWETPRILPHIILRGQITKLSEGGRGPKTRMWRRIAPWVRQERLIFATAVLAGESSFPQFSPATLPCVTVGGYGGQTLLVAPSPAPPGHRPSNVPSARNLDSAPTRRTTR